MPLCKDLPIVGALGLSATVTAAAAAAIATTTIHTAEFEIRSTGLVGSGPEERSATAAYSHDSN